MNNFSVASYICSASICFSMAMVLLFVHISILDGNIVYQRIKRFLAYSALLDVLVDLLAISLFAYQKDIFILDIFFIPMIYSIQLWLMTKSLLGLIHDATLRFVTSIWYFLPITLVALAYWVGFLVYCGADRSRLIYSYIEYTGTSFSKLTCGVFYLLLLGNFLCEIGILAFETFRYIRKLNNYYSGTEVIKGKQLSYFIFCYLSYFVLAALDFCLSSHSLDACFMMVNTVIFLSFTIHFFNLQSIYLKTSVPTTFDVSNDTDAVLGEMASDRSAGKLSAAEADATEGSIVRAIRQWEQLTHKPYLKDGILIADVAHELGISEVQLSFILNHSLKINFNTWINKLRIEESKRIIQSHPQMNISEVALSSGFRDSACFSKTFKKIAGEPPIVYKKSLTD